jgi:SAM-dependent methyltransferase
MHKLTSFKKAYSLFKGETDTSKDIDDKLERVKTDNSLGWMSMHLEPISKAFVDFSMLSKLPVLDIGTAYGYVPSEIIRHKVNIIANDLHKPHLDFLYTNTPEELKKYLILNNNKFPNEIDFEPNSISAILASRVFHFLSGSDLEKGIRKMHNWLVPNGKVFIYTCTPYRSNLVEFSKKYDELKSKVKFPGEVESFKSIDIEQGKLLEHDFFIHFMDVDVLKRLFLEADFDVEMVDYIDIDLPSELKSGGKENVGLIARKR